VRLGAFQRLDPHSARPIAVAVSGGGDSLFALIQTCAWAAKVGRRVLALSVDHGLQADSAAWTAFAGEQALRLGADFRALRWTEPKPTTGIPAAARATRHALLAESARAAGCTVIVTGHTASDQAENAAMGLGRLREWNPSPAWPEGRGVFLLRPLLGMHRAKIREVMRADGWRWIDDPANQDPRYLRARVRMDSPPPCGEGSEVGESARTPGSFTPIPDPSPQGGRGQESGALLFARSALTSRSLAFAAVCAGGGSRIPRSESVEAILHRLRAGEHFTATLCGARIEATDTVTFTREATRGGLPAFPIPLGQPTVWDGRFEIEALVPGLSVRPLAGAAARLSLMEKATLRRIDARARPALPLIQRSDGTVFCPILSRENGVRARSLVTARSLAACGALQTEQQACDVVSVANGATASYLEVLG
jgi:tRNA(Ile)-lysidine synthase